MNPKPGRPAADPDNPRVITIQVRIRLKDKQAIDRWCGCSGETVSSWVNNLIRRKLQQIDISMSVGKNST